MAVKSWSLINSGASRTHRICSVHDRTAGIRFARFKRLVAFGALRPSSQNFAASMVTSAASASSRGVWALIAREKLRAVSRGEILRTIVVGRTTVVWRGRLANRLDIFHHRFAASVPRGHVPTGGGVCRSAALFRRRNAVKYEPETAW